MNIPEIKVEIKEIIDVKDAIKGFALLFKKDPEISLGYYWGYWRNVTWDDGYKDKDFVFVRDDSIQEVISVGNKSIKCRIYDTRLKRLRTVDLRPINEDTDPDSSYFSYIILQS